MDTYPLMVGFSLAIGVGLIVNATLSSFYELGRRWLRLLGRRRYRLHALGINGQNQGHTSEDEILGLTRIPWTNLYAGAAILGLALFFWIGQAVPSIRLGFLAAPALVWLFKGYLIRQRRRFLLGQLRQLLIDVRLHMSLRGSLLLGLESIASTTGENQLVYRLLRLRMSGGQVKSGLEIFQQMAKDLQIGAPDPHHAAHPGRTAIRRFTGRRSGSRKIHRRVDRRYQRADRRANAAPAAAHHAPGHALLARSHRHPVFLPARRPHSQNPLGNGDWRRILILKESIYVV